MAQIPRDDFYPFMKVSLNGECGVVIDRFFEVSSGSLQNEKSKIYGVIIWDTNKEGDLEDWRGSWGTFTEQGGHEIYQGYKFKFINDDGTLKI